MSDYLPNSFQTPNAYVDRLMALLTSDEYKVLSYAARRIFGFQKRQDRIALSQFADGVVNRKTGERFDYGTGLSVPTCRRAVRTLVQYGVLIEEAPNDSTRNEGTLYSLQTEAHRIDFAGLEARHRETATRNAARTERATAVRMEGGPPIVGHTPLRQTLGDTSHDTTPLTSDDTTPPNVGRQDPPLRRTSTQNTEKPRETQGETTRTASDGFTEAMGARPLAEQRARMAEAARHAPRPVRLPDILPAEVQTDLQAHARQYPHISADRTLAWFRRDHKRDLHTMAEWVSLIKAAIDEDAAAWTPHPAAVRRGQEPPAPVSSTGANALQQKLAARRQGVN